LLSNIAQSIIHALFDIFRSGVRGIAQWLISIDRAIGIAMQIVARAKARTRKYPSRRAIIPP
jgi:hypothetical protein